jgi:hypothetical protein
LFLLLRFHNAISPLQDTAELIAQELLPSKTGASIVTRYKNQVRRKGPRAVLLLSHALLGKERPAAWGNADSVARRRTNPELAAAAGA